VCCQKVSEAEALVYRGVNDVLVTNEIVGGQKLRRLTELAFNSGPPLVCEEPAGSHERPTSTEGSAFRA
jgi:D-serine deaminase-like pyridoxal phosphate-dependent protein